MDLSFGMPLSPPKIIDGVTLKFPAKLWRIVNNCKTGAITWDSSGNSIRIQRKQFEVEYLSSSKYFKTTNFPSFVRQLNIYGFRKIPTSSRWQDNGTVFEYRHDYFVKGHPELLPEVRRNTAVRRTLREAALTDTDTIITHSSIKFPVVSKSKELSGTKNMRKKVDDSHPLLKTKTSTVLKYTIPQQQNLNGPKITTVYMNPRLPTASDMQRMSPTKLHEQIADLLPAMNNSDEEDGPFLNRQSTRKHNLNKPFDSHDSRYMDMCKSVRNPILFLPSSSNNETLDINNSFSLSSLSQESTDSNTAKQLMFSCPVDKDEIDDTFNLPCEDDEFTQDDVKVTGVSKGLSGESCLDTNCSGLDTLTQQLFMSDSLPQLGDEQGFLTPAYFNPETGIVTLLLPTLNPEA